MKFRYFFVIYFLNVVVMMTGCAGTDNLSAHHQNAAIDPADSLILEKKVYDVRYLNIAGFEHVKVDRYLLERVESYEKLQGVSAKKNFIEAFLNDAFLLNDKLVSTVANRLPDEDLVAYFESVSQAQGGDWDAEDDDLVDANVPGENVRARFINNYRLHAQKEFKKQLSTFLNLQNEEQIDDYWYYLVANIEESILTRGRTSRLLFTAPLVPVIYAWIWYIALTEDREAHLPDFIERTVFYPDDTFVAADPAEITDEWALLNYYAPVFVLGNDPHPSYGKHVDRFGEIWMDGLNPDDATPQVSTEKPTVYAYLETKKTSSGVTRQLVYARWYPEHPKLRNMDPEAGHIDGWTLRISLNEDNRPLLFESVASCGCYYKVFPTARLEKWSEEEYPEKIDGKKFFLEKNVPYKIDVVIPELISFGDQPTQKIVAYYSAGKHHLETIRPIEKMEAVDHAAPQETYQLVPYAQLENLPFHDYQISLFDENGLVRKAHRMECTLLVPSGLFHAGHPRQRNTQLIYFDQAPFDDNELFDTYMRMPANVFRRPF